MAHIPNFALHGETHRSSPLVNPSVLNSWKEIAGYLNRGVRTVQRWEQDLQLPVHRIGRGKRSPVYARISEIDFWMMTSEARSAWAGSAVPERTLPNQRDHGGTPLAKRLYQLALSVAENTLRHQLQTQELQKHIRVLRSRVASRDR